MKSAVIPVLQVHVCNMETPGGLLPVARITLGGESTLGIAHPCDFVGIENLAWLLSPRAN